MRCTRCGEEAVGRVGHHGPHGVDAEVVVEAVCEWHHARLLRWPRSYDADETLTAAVLRRLSVMPSTSAQVAEALRAEGRDVGARDTSSVLHRLWVREQVDRGGGRPYVYQLPPRRACIECEQVWQGGLSCPKCEAPGEPL